MGKRNLADIVEQQQHFEATHGSSPEEDNGTRDLGPLYPFIISGGTNTERCYFTHINDTTEYKFNIYPKYFGEESSYTEVFPKKIKEILEKNLDAKIFCVFDWDTIYKNDLQLRKHEAFIRLFKSEISKEVVIICPSMPSIEYWFLLHFENYTKLIKSCGRKMQQLLSPHMAQYFPSTNKKLINLLKDKKYIESNNWVIELCKDGKLEKAIGYAENNIQNALTINDLDNQSYSYIYKIFK